MWFEEYDNENPDFTHLHFIFWLYCRSTTEQAKLPLLDQNRQRQELLTTLTKLSLTIVV